MATISAPVSTEKVKLALSEKSNDVGTLCSSGKINMWAKYKPIRYPSAKRLTDAQRKGTDGNRGLSIPTAKTILAVMDYYDGGMNGWEYLKPTGGSTAPYRLGDFEGYNGDAIGPVGGLAVASQIMQGSDIAVSAEIIMSDEQDDTQLQLKDFAALGNCYFGVALVKDNSVKYRLTTKQTLLEGAGLDIVFSNNGGAWPVGSYKAIPFMSSAKYATTDTSDVQAVYIPLPVMQPVTFQVISQAAAIDVSIYATYSTTSKRVINIELTNNGDTAYTNVYVYCLLDSRRLSTALVEAIQAGEATKSVAVLQAGATVQLQFNSTGAPDSSSGSWTYCTWGQVSFNGGKAVKVFMVDQSIEEQANFKSI